MDTDQTQVIDDSEDTSGESTQAAETDLDALRAEWNETTEQKPQPKPQPAPKQVERTEPAPVEQPDYGKLIDAIKPVVSHIESERAQKQQAEAKKEVETAVAAIKGEDLGQVDDEVAEGFLLARYNHDNSFREAYNQRQSNPNAWTTALDGARNAFKEKMAPFTSVRTDIEAATAAAEGQSTGEADQQVSNDDLMKMSDAEFAAFKQGLDPD